MGILIPIIYRHNKGYLYKDRVSPRPSTQSLLWDRFAGAIPEILLWLQASGNFKPLFRKACQPGEPI